MRWKRGFTRGRAVAVLIAAAMGYAVGGWHTTALQTAALQTHDISAAQTVSLRFPENWDGPSVAESDAVATSAAVIGNAQFALLSPEPLVQSDSRDTVQEATGPAADTGDDGGSAAQTPAPSPSADPSASLSNSATAERPATAAAQPAAAHVAVASRPGETKPNAAAIAADRHKAERPGFVLNDAQIASIKQRLHLTEDQERMWPAVEAALRNIAYTRTREAHRREAPVTAAQLASADPNSVEVQGLKSAAIPLIMSFNSEQRDEVRNLAHVMGLDQLASQF